MEKKEVIKMEEITMGSSLFADHVSDGNPFSGVFDFYEGEKSSLGFMELLAGVQDYSPSMFDLPQAPSMAPSAPAPAPAPAAATTVTESSEVLNQPATPNSSSISSASSDAVNDEQTKAVDEEEEQDEKAKKLLKPKRKNQKRQRESRVAFMTKSEVDHLEDGYRWRKYGQKAVKNSPFPRSYYRCTTALCNVKKRVERSFTDSSVVVTTYEGQHTHPSPVMARPSFTGAPSGSGVSAGCGTTFAMPMPRTLSHFQQQYQQSLINTLSTSNFAYNGIIANPSFVRESRFCTPGAAAGLLRDHGLLQDIVPSHMLKEE